MNTLLLRAEVIDNKLIENLMGHFGTQLIG